MNAVNSNPRIASTPDERTETGHAAFCRSYWGVPSLYPPTTTSGSLRITELAGVIETAIATNHPHHNSYCGPTGAFGGCYDWHSAVHGHWALISIARVMGNTDLQQRIVSRLDDATLRAEADFLQTDPTFEVPYGRAWFLLLLRELKHIQPGSRVRGEAEDEAQRFLLDWLEQSPYPESSSGFSAAHSSWLFTYMLFLMSRPSARAVIDRLAALRESKIEPNRRQLWEVQHSSWDFMYLPAVQAVVDRLDPGDRVPIEPYPLEQSASLCTSPVDRSTAHSAGAAAVHLWPLAMESHRGNLAARSAFHARFDQIFARTDLWAGPFEHVSHWVPQFLWMAIWLEIEQP